MTCPSCGGPLVYDGADGYICDRCGDEWDADTVVLSVRVSTVRAYPGGSWHGRVLTPDGGTILHVCRHHHRSTRTAYDCAILLAGDLAGQQGKAATIMFDLPHKDTR